MTHEIFVNTIEGILGDNLTRDQITRLENLVTQYDHDKAMDVIRYAQAVVGECVLKGFNLDA